MKIHDFIKKKSEQQKIVMLTCYDYPSAQIIAESKVDCVLVGDSVAMAVHGHATTITATLEMMILHTQAVAKGLNQQFIVSDMPFLAHKSSLPQTVQHVKALIQAGAHAVKIEGADIDTCSTIAYLVESGIPIMGHIGLTPQSIHQLGGYKIQGKNEKQSELLKEQALALEKAGCFAVVIECVPQALAKEITDLINIPTIGIGAGSGTDGQVLVWHDMLGIQTSFNPKFVKKYAQAKEYMLDAINEYAMQVQGVHFPSPDYAF